MADELLAALVAVLGGAVLAAVTLAGAYLRRRLHEHAERILALEMTVDRLRLVAEDEVLEGGRQGLARRRKRRAD